MYKILVPTEKSIYELGELAKEFLTIDNFEFVIKDETNINDQYDLIIPESDSKFVRGKALYDFLSQKLNKSQDWGILVGVRPKKLYSELVKKNGKEKAEELLDKEYCLSAKKIKLLRDTYECQEKAIENSKLNSVGLYIGIPFCPTRCVYCSFTSNKITDEAAKAYLVALKKEISSTASILKNKNLVVESIYIGGGTPTSLCNEDFDELMDSTYKAFNSDELKEFTVECGRPDTINEYKLKSILAHGAGRISINPQTMKANTLKLIGRDHTPEDIIEKYDLARSVGDFVINMDLIAGLPEETPEDFVNTLTNVTSMDPENITVHTLAVKKASRLIEQDAEYNYRQSNTVAEMLKFSSAHLEEKKYIPYYLYRQKHMTGNFENVGYCKDGFPNLYNIRIMEENQTIIALGAGGISKLYYPEENRLERIPNVSNYQIYIERIDEMIERKEKGI